MTPGGTTRRRRHRHIDEELEKATATAASARDRSPARVLEPMPDLEDFVFATWGLPILDHAVSER